MLIKLIAFFAGFLLSSVIDTTLGEFSEWAIVGSAIVVASLESISKVYYTLFFKNSDSIKKESKENFLIISNYTKLGIIYGLIVDAFKLGS